MEYQPGPGGVKINEKPGQKWLRKLQSWKRWAEWGLAAGPRSMVVGISISYQAFWASQQPKAGEEARHGQDQTQDSHALGVL